MSASEWVTVLGAIAAGIGGIVSAWAALVKARNEGREACEQMLRSLRRENEAIAVELHDLRMRKALDG